MKTAQVGKLSWRAKIVLILLPVAAMLIALSVGRIGIPLDEICRSVAAKVGWAQPLSDNAETVLWTMRFPRILLALLTGAGLSVAGCVFQSLFANPLATPDTLGVASGAGFGAALAILLGFNLVGIQISSLIFGIAAVSLSYLAGWGRGHSLNTIILAGIMIGSLFNALLSLVKYVADVDSQLPAITYWLMGSLNTASYKSLAMGAPLILIGIAVTFLLRWRMNVLPLSEDEAKTSGVNITVLRIIMVFAATAITASCVSMCGQVGWIGLLIPHICRMKFGNNHLSLVPASIFIGAAFMVLVDTLARCLTASEIPVSIITAILGAPFFVYLLRKSGGWKL